MEDGEDLISRLPDEIITRILSLTSTKRAMATSVLSKRWKLVWTLVPNLLFDFCYRCSSRTEEEQQANFENFVDHVLSLNNVVSVRNAKLFCYRTDALRINAWLEALAMRSVEKFDLGLPRSFGLNLFPDAFFNQKHLVKLTLFNVVLKVPPSACFPCPESVRLNSVQFVDDESITNLLSGCPALTDLLVHPTELSRKQTLCIRSSTLQTLKIYGLNDKHHVVQVIIDAEKLTYLNIDQVRSNVTFDLIDVSSLMKASISYVTEDDRLFEFLGKISHVKELLLDWCIFRWHFEQKSQLSLLRSLLVLYNLDRLTLEIGSKEGLNILPQVLEYTPHSVNVVLKLTSSCHRCPWKWNGPLDLPQSISSCIESVEITKENGLSVVSCILNNASTSKRLSFHGLLTHAVQENEVIKTFLAAGKILGS